MNEPRCTDQLLDPPYISSFSRSELCLFFLFRVHTIDQLMRRTVWPMRKATPKIVTLSRFRQGVELSRRDILFQPFSLLYSSVRIKNVRYIKKFFVQKFTFKT